MVSEEWIDRKEGVKSHKFIVDGMLFQALNQGESDKGYGKYTMQSKEYDKLFDTVIEHLLERELDSESPLGVEFSGWKKREGKEVYTYASVSEMLDLACESSEIAKDGHILLPKTESDIKILSRNYYNRYLQEVIDMPEFDGKQIMCFYKIPLQEAFRALDCLESSQTITGTHGVREKIRALL